MSDESPVAQCLSNHVTMHPWLSIVTITKDDPKGLARTLANTATWRNDAGVEQIVVFAGEAPNISGESVTFVRQSSDGIAGAFNEGLAEARGEWVWFLNGGDAIHEQLDRAWLKALLERTRAQVVTGALHYDGEAEPRSPPPLPEQWPLLTSWLPHPATLVRRSALIAAGGFDVRWRICMDFDLWQRLLNGAGAVDMVAVPFARFDVNGMSRRPENLNLLYRENAAVLWRHRARILGTYWRGGCWILRVFYRAARSHWS